MASRDLRFNLVGKDVSASKALEGVAGSAGKLESSLAGIGKAFVGLAAVKVGWDFLKSSVKDAAESERANLALGNSVAHKTLLAKGAQAAFEAQANALQKVTATDDEQVKSGQAVLRDVQTKPGPNPQAHPLVAGTSPRSTRR